MIKDLYILFGPPGSGKTAQAIFLSNLLKLNHISWGNIFGDKRYSIKYHNQLSIVNKTSTSDFLRSKKIAEIIDSEITKLDKVNQRGLILDGFPRRMEEGKLLLKICKRHGYKIKALIRINPSFETAFNRFTKRFICEKCGHYFDKEPEGSIKGKYCNKDRGRLKKVKTSKNEFAREFSYYLEKCQPLFEFLKKYSELYFDVSGDDEPVIISSGILLKLKNKTTTDYRIFKKKVATLLHTKFGDFRFIPYQSEIDYKYHLALVKGKVRNKDGVLVRVHSSCVTGDIFGSLLCDCGEQLHKSLELINKEGTGVVIYLFQEGRGINIVNKAKAYHLQSRGLDTVEANERMGFPQELREYEAVKDILEELGIRSISLLTNNPDKIRKITDLGIVVKDVVPIETKPSRYNKKYLLTKKDKMGHRLSLTEEDTHKKSALRVVLGSKSEDKKRVVKQTLSGLASGVELQGVDVSSGIVEQPLDEETTITGAVNRAIEALKRKPNSDIGLGLEGGLVEVNRQKYYLVCVAAIYDKHWHVYLGISSKLRVPKIVSKKVERGYPFGQVIREYAERHKSDYNIRPIIDSLIQRNEAFSEAIRNAYLSFTNQEHFI